MVLVTGASGFIGQHLVRYLSGKGQLVRALYNSHQPSAHLKALPGVTWQCCDLLDVYAVEEAMAGITEAYHCAAIVSFDTGDRQRILHFNIESTANVVNMSLEAGVRKMVYLSSVASLGRSELSKVITEEEQWEESRFNSVYAQSKHQAELEVWRGMGEGLEAVIVNPGIVLGEGDWDRGTGRLMKMVFKEFPFYTGGINAWADVKDVVEIMYRLMESDIHSERFIISAGNYAYKDIFTWMAAALGKKPPYIRTTALMSGILWRWQSLKKAMGGRSPVITKETARTAQRQSFYDNNKLPQYLRNFSYTPIRQTIERMATVYKLENS